MVTMIMIITFVFCFQLNGHIFIRIDVQYLSSVTLLLFIMDTGLVYYKGLMHCYIIQATETEFYKRIDTMKSTYYRPFKYFCQNFYIAKVLSLLHGNLNVPLHVLHKIVNKICVKVIIAQNDTEML